MDKNKKGEPGWGVVVFYVAIIVAIIYLGRNTFFPTGNSDDDYYPLHSEEDYRNLESCVEDYEAALSFITDEIENIMYEPSYDDLIQARSYIYSYVADARGCSY